MLLVALENIYLEEMVGKANHVTNKHFKTYHSVINLHATFVVNYIRKIYRGRGMGDFLKRI